MATLCSPGLTLSYLCSLLLGTSMTVSAGAGACPYGFGVCGGYCGCPGCWACEAHSWLLWFMAAQLSMRLTMTIDRLSKVARGCRGAVGVNQTGCDSRTERPRDFPVSFPAPAGRFSRADARAKRAGPAAPRHGIRFTDAAK